jgi:hypothetical protein
VCSKDTSDEEWAMETSLPIFIPPKASIKYNKLLLRSINISDCV